MVKDYWPGDPPTPPTTGSGVKPPPRDYGSFVWDEGTIHHYIYPEGSVAYSGALPIEWHPTGAFRFRAGWFGRITLEQQEVASPGIIKAVYRWRRAPRGTLVMLHNLPQPRN